MSFDASLSPIPAEGWTPAAARHLAWRAGFGGTPRELVELHGRGLDDAVAGFLEPGELPDPPDALDPDVLRPLPAETRLALRRDRSRGGQETELQREVREARQSARRQDRQMFTELQRWWVGRLLAPPAPLHERLVLLWHNHFATSHRNVRDAYLMYRQHAMLWHHAFDFSKLSRGIVRDPAMLRFLNNDANRRVSPNENLSRELLELFTLGVGNYREADIKEGARALTGYAVDDNEFLFRKFAHDGQSKTILGQTGKFDGDDFVVLLLRRDACARFVALKLYDHLVYDVGDDWDLVPKDRQRVITQLGRLVKQHQYDLKSVLATLFKSRHFYDPANVGRKIKSPAQVLAGTRVALQTPNRGVRRLASSMERMGMALFEPPSVNGWDSGPAWINTSTLFVRQNLAVYLLTGKRPGESFDLNDVSYDPGTLLAGLASSERQDPRRVVDHLADAVLGPHVPAERRSPLIAFASGRERGPADPQALLGLLCTMTAMPEYQLC